jgi:hypothetical protein
MTGWLLGVLGNLIASFAVWFPHFIWLHKAHRRLHDRLDRIEGNQNAIRKA